LEWSLLGRFFEEFTSLNKSRETQGHSLGRINAGSGIGLAVFGLEDEYGRRRDSLWNRYVNKEPQ
jgi:hypothetical protein